MQRDRSEISLNIPNSFTQAKIIHGSIWDDEQILDVIGLNLLSKHSLHDYSNGNYNKNNEKNKISTVDSFFEAKSKVMDINGRSFAEIMADCKAKGCQRIGLTPWKKGDYKEVIEYLKNNSDKAIISINFYHLNKKDFKALREVDWSK
jgi:hypothetical protein